MPTERDFHQQLAAVSSILDELAVRLPPERWAALRRDLSALLNAWSRGSLHASEACRLLHELSSRYEFRSTLDAAIAERVRAYRQALPSTTRGRPHDLAPERVDPDITRGARGPLLTLLNDLQQRLRPAAPPPLVVWPEIITPRAEVALDTTFTVQVTLRHDPGVTSERVAMVVERARRGAVELEVELELHTDALTPMSPTRARLELPESELDSISIAFTARATALGTHDMTILIRRVGETIARVSVRRSVCVVAATRPHGDRDHAREPLAPRPLPASAPGLALRVTRRHHDGAKTVFKVELRTPRERPASGLIELPHDTASLLIGLCTEFRDALRVRNTAVIDARVMNVGTNLTRGLLPDTVASALANPELEGTALHIESETPWLPWEVMRIGDAASGFFLGEKFAITRFPVDTRGWHQTRILPRRPLLVAPPCAGFSSSRERRALQRVSRRAPLGLTTVSQLVEMFAGTERLGLLHFSCHGLAKPDDLKGGVLDLEDGSLRAIDVPRLDVTVDETPLLGALVFVNACESGIPSRKPWGHGSWAQAFIDAGAAAVIVTSWSVGTHTAEHFAEEFYHRLELGDGVGEAARRARLAARRMGDPDWLCFAVFAAPDATLATEP